MSYQVISIQMIKNEAAFTAKYRHNYRIFDVPNANKDLSKMNEQIISIPAGQNYYSFFINKIRELPYYGTHKIRKNANLGIEVLLSFGKDDLPKDFCLEKWKEQSKQFLIDFFGRENIASAVIHMDEHTPHIHAVMIPIADGKLSSCKFVGTREKMRNMHSMYHEYTKECGLERGAKYCNTISHIRIGEYYKNIDVSIEKSLPGPEERETLEVYVERANKFYQEQMRSVILKERKLKNTQKRVKALESANTTLQKKSEKQISDIMKQIGSVENAKDAIYYRNSLLAGIEYTRQSNPDLAFSVEEIINNMHQRYEREMWREEHPVWEDQVQEEI